jgi:Predicted signaling protein consisting of a modified GGDEF domain and a DHH domain
MKKWNPLLVLFLSFILYLIVLCILASAIDSQHPGGEQYFLTVFAKGIDLSPIIGIILFGIICLIYKEWTIRNKWLSIILLILLLVASTFLLFFNHS